MPPIEEICYTAGFFDGEGSCCLTVNKNYYQPYIEIANTSRETLFAIQRAISLGDVREKSGVPAHHKRQYSLKFPRNHMVKFCKMILPYVKLKKRQLELMVKFLETTEDQVTEREAIREEMTALNKRGRELAN